MFKRQIPGPIQDLLIKHGVTSMDYKIENKSGGWIDISPKKQNKETRAQMDSMEGILYEAGYGVLVSPLYSFMTITYERN